MVWIVAAALGAEPAELVVESTDAGAVRGSVWVASPPEPLRALLRDPTARVAALASGVAVRAERDQECWLEHTTVDHPVKAVTYTVRSCPTADGLRSTLVESPDMTRMVAVWRVEPAEGGSRVVYELDTAPSFPLPAFLVRASVRSGVTDALTRLRDRF